jgi:nuclear pore complex protein Nup155
MLLALACGNSFLELDDMSMLGTISNLGPQFADVAKQAFYDFGERPHFTERLTHGNGASAEVSVRPSVRGADRFDR